MGRDRDRRESREGGRGRDGRERGEGGSVRIEERVLRGGKE